MKNECIECKKVWTVDLRYATLDSTDVHNVQAHNQLFSTCEDCNASAGNGYECTSEWVNTKMEAV